MDEVLRELKDRTEICELKARYFRAVDTQDWTLLESLFVPDATFSSGKVGASAFVHRSRAFLEGGWSVHHGHTPELQIFGDHASGIWAMDDYLGRSTGEVVRGYGHYSETYIRTQEGWKISSLNLTRLREEELPSEDPAGWVAPVAPRQVPGAHPRTCSENS